MWETLVTNEVDEAHQAHWFELMEYPCLSFTAMARKMLVSQLARHKKRIGMKPYENKKKYFT